MRRFAATVFALLLAAAAGFGFETSNLSFPPPSGMTRADVWFANTAKDPKAVLVLCPGMNGNGKPLVEDPKWQNFAAGNRLALAGLSFASPPSQLYANTGYTFPEQGSGEILLAAVRERFGRDLPLLIYGFSSGAYFTESFVNWRPDSVVAWCAHATGRFEDCPKAWPPGIVSCGESDGTRLGAALTHFKKGRAAGSRLLWTEVGGCGHQWPEKLDSFVRDYFFSLLNPAGSGIWIDVETGEVLAENAAAKQPTMSGWLPAKELLQKWTSINTK